jgi:hypothetical protein
MWSENLWTPASAGVTEQLTGHSILWTRTKATDIEVALILNFGERPYLKRLIFDNARKQLRASSAQL